MKVNFVYFTIFQTVFSDVFEKTLQYIQELTNDDMKQKVLLWWWLVLEVVLSSYTVGESWFKFFALLA